jgi:hypothetical protein
MFDLPLNDALDVIEFVEFKCNRLCINKNEAPAPTKWRYVRGPFTLGNRTWLESLVRIALTTMNKIKSFMAKVAHGCVTRETVHIYSCWKSKSPKYYKSSPIKAIHFSPRF